MLSERVLTRLGEPRPPKHMSNPEDRMKMYPHLENMASGNKAIVLQGNVTYDNFPEVAVKWAKHLTLHIVSKIDGVDERMWDCRIGAAKFWLAHDNWFPEISLEPQNDDTGTLVAQVFDKLMKEMKTK